ncbi:AaceriABL178Wp [[Ashbya] aceris (nom. inval.)]|nr:AaceriABL178Wp [[Ashbya] aceris (nom. inval.)]
MVCFPLKIPTTASAAASLLSSDTQNGHRRSQLAQRAMKSDMSDENGYEDGSAEDYSLQEVAEDELYADGDNDDGDYQYDEGEDDEESAPSAKRTSRAARQRVVYDYGEPEEEYEEELDEELDEEEMAADEVVSPRKKKVSAITFAEDDEDDDDDEDDEDDEEAAVVARARANSRNKMVLDLMDENNVRKRGTDHLTEEELQLRRAENARKRRNLSEKKLEEEKQDTINKLLKRRAGKSRSNLQASEKEASVEEADYSKPRRPYHAIGMLRVLRTVSEDRFAIAPRQVEDGVAQHSPTASES